MKRKDILGKRFGRLEVISYAGLKPKSGKNRSYWLCKCECGNEKEILGQSLNKGWTQSCGCLHKETASQQGRKNGKGLSESTFNTLYGKYKYQALRRNLSFELPKEIFGELTKQSCFYCGALPSTECKTKHNTGNYIYNGIDRVDNSKGYTKENCVPCCEICNKAKRDLSLEDFYNWIERIHERRHQT